MESLYQLCFLSQDLLSDELYNLVLDNLRKRYQEMNGWPSQARISHVYRNTGYDSSLRSFVTSCAHYRLMILKEKIHTYFADPTAGNDFVRDYVQHVQDVAEGADGSDPRHREGCHFHNHSEHENEIPLANPT